MRLDSSRCLCRDTWFALLFLALLWSGAPRWAQAELHLEASVAIHDVGEKPITAILNGGIDELSNHKVTAPDAKPGEIEFSIRVDVSNGDAIVAGTGMALLLERDGKVSDILRVTITRGQRNDVDLNKAIFFITATITFTSDSDPGGLPLDIDDEEIKKKILARGLVEDGTTQTLSTRLIDVATGKDLDTFGLFIVAQSVDAPEPSGILLVGSGLLVLGVLRRRSGRPVTPASSRAR